MATLYGIPYMGSKTKICVDILRQLPKGNRFVDLFGGGFAMTHAAILTRRYNHFYYSDINPLIVNLIKEALDGKYNYSQFQPEFITREKYNAEKGTSGYVKYIWSYGNRGDSYMFGKNVEPLKHAAHDFVVFGRWTKDLEAISSELRTAVKSKNIRQRRLEFCGWCRAHKKRFDLQQLERLERLEQTIVCNCGSYLEYEYQEGDVVYLDPPYEGTAEYDDEFNHDEFYDWCISRPYQVWFSSYKISDKRFRMVWARQLRTSFGQGNRTANYECLYTNK